MHMAYTYMHMYTNKKIHTCTHIHGRDLICRSENPVPFLGFLSLDSNHALCKSALRKVEGYVYPQS